MKPVLLAIALFAFIKPQAQGVFSNSTIVTLQKVVSDYPNHFSNISGEIIRQSEAQTDYLSLLSIPGAISCTVSRSSNERKDTYSWKCVLFETDKFSVVKSRYRQIFDQIRNSIIKIEGEKPFILNGPASEPSEHKRQHTISFRLLPATGGFATVRIDLNLYKEANLWKISLMVHSPQPSVGAE